MLSAAVRLRERGAVPRRLRKVHTAASRNAWGQVAIVFHRDMVPKRFTQEHAIKANYEPRKGELMPRGSKAWRNSYYGRKFLSPSRGGGEGKADPLVNEGRTKSLVVGGMPAATVTSKGAKVRYSWANTLNFRARGSQVNMREEFTTVLESEAVELGKVWDREYESHMAADSGGG